jgi:hypothetical protein
MESPLIVHEQTKRIDNIEHVAWERLFANYLILNLKGQKKLIEIDSTDQESVLNKKMPPAFPGMIYTFININEQNLAQITNAATGKTVQFHDFTPILFCTSFNPLHNNIKGLNLNILPKDARLRFLEAYYQYYKNFFKDVELKTEYGKEALNKKYVIASIIGRNPVLFKKFNSDYGAKFEFAYRSYKLENLRNYRMLEYEEWKYIPFYDAKIAFKNVNLEMIYRTYNENKNKT